MALDQDISRLAQIPMLGVLDEGALRLLAFTCETRMLRPGDVLFREGERASCGYLVLTGSLELAGGPTVAGEPVVVETGVLVGETALIRETARPVTAVAREASTVLRISRTLFTRILREHPGSATKLQSFLTDRFRSRMGFDGA